MARPLTLQTLKIPPHSAEVEQTVLGSLLIDPNTIIKVADILVPEDFYTPAHEKIYSAMLDLYSKNQPIDVMSVTNRLKEKNLLSDVGGTGYLAELTNQVATASHADSHAGIVKEKRMLRDVIKIAGEMAEDAWQAPEDVEVLLDGIEQKIMAISQRSVKQGFTHIKHELQEAYDRIEKLNQGAGALRGVPTGFKKLDGILSGLQKSDLIIIGGRPSVGKTTLALDIARNAAKASGQPVAFFSIEMSKDQVIDRIIAAESGVSLWKLRTGRVREDVEYQMIQEALERLSNTHIFINDAASPNILQMRSTARRLQSEHGLGLVVIDYLQLITPRTKSDNMVQQVTEISRSVKALARELNVPVVALSQLSREVDKRDDKRPKLSDLRESGSIEQDADVVMLLSRAKERRGGDTSSIDLAGGADENIIHVDIAKHRNGPLGFEELMLDKDDVTFRSIDQKHGEMNVDPFDVRQN